MSSEKKTDSFEIFLNVIIIATLLVLLWLFAMIIMLFIGESDSVAAADKIIKPTQLESLSQQSIEQEGLEQLIQTAETNTEAQELTTEAQKLEATKQKLETAIQKLASATHKLDITKDKLAIAKHKSSTKPSQELTTEAQKLEATKQKLETAIHKLASATHKLDITKDKLAIAKQKSSTKPSQEFEQEGTQNNTDDENNLSTDNNATKNPSSSNSADVNTNIETESALETEPQKELLENSSNSSSTNLSNLPSVIFDCEIPIHQRNGIAKLVIDTSSSSKTLNTHAENSDIKKINANAYVKAHDNIEIQFHYAYGGTPLQTQVIMSIEQVSYARPINAHVLLLQDSIYYYRFVQFYEPTSSVAGMMSIYTKKSHNLINHYNCSSSSILDLNQVIRESSKYSLIELDELQSQKFLNF